MNKSAKGHSMEKLRKVVDIAARYLPRNSPIKGSRIPEEFLVQLARRSTSLELRSSLGELYRAGYFDHRDIVKGYAWTLAAWNTQDRSYDEKFALAEAQQYYEFFLSADEKSRALQILEQVLSSAEKSQFSVGNPFNARWWGWEDDPIPARPGERDFKAGFVQWLQDGGYAEGDIADIVAQCPPSDGPTRMERIHRDAEETVRRLGFTAAGDATKGKLD